MGKYTDDEICNAAKITIKIAADYLSISPNILTLGMRNNLLPIGSLIYCMFCVTRYGWGYDSFLVECNTGKGIKLARWLRPYLAYVLPAVILYIFIQGYIVKFFA